MESYAQENARLKGQVENLEMHNRTILGQLRQLRHLVDKTTSNVASSQTISTSSPSKNSTTNNSKKTSSNSSNSNTNAATNSSAYLMVFLACFAALFAGQPDYPSSSSNSNSQIIPSSSPKGHIVGDLSTFGSLHQVIIIFSLPQISILVLSIIDFIVFFFLSDWLHLVSENSENGTKAGW